MVPVHNAILVIEEFDAGYLHSRQHAPSLTGHTITNILTSSKSIEIMSCNIPSYAKIALNDSIHPRGDAQIRLRIDMPLDLELEAGILVIAVGSHLYRQVSRLALGVVLLTYLWLIFPSENASNINVIAVADAQSGRKEPRVASLLKIP